MPTVKIIDSVKIDIYSREHPPPHFHAIYADQEILISILDLKIYAGRMPKPQLGKVMEWAGKNKVLLMENFKRLNPGL